MSGRGNDEEPLKSEQLKRDKWRGDETFLDGDDAEGHTLPESERDQARIKPGAGGDDTGRTIAPPD